jgi:hypothetical protein
MTDKPTGMNILQARETGRLIGADLAQSEGVEPAATFADLHTYVTAGDPVMSPRLARELITNPRLQSDLRALVEDQAMYQADRVVAASSRDSDTRYGPGFTLELRASRTADGQAYAIIAVTDPARIPHALLILVSDGTWLKLPLSEPANGRIQIMFEADDPALSALRDSDSELFLL